MIDLCSRCDTGYHEETIGEKEKPDNSFLEEEFIDPNETTDPLGE